MHITDILDEHELPATLAGHKLFSARARTLIATHLAELTSPSVLRHLTVWFADVLARDDLDFAAADFVREVTGRLASKVRPATHLTRQQLDSLLEAAHEIKDGLLRAFVIDWLTETLDS